MFFLYGFLYGGKGTNKSDIEINETSETEININKEECFSGKKINELLKKEEYDDVISICTEILRTENLQQDEEVYILSTLGEAYEKNGNINKSILALKLLINKYDAFENKEDIMYKLCLNMYSVMPKRHEIDLEKCKDFISYACYCENSLINSERKKKIKEMKEEAQKLIEQKKISDILFYYENKLYKPAIYCCDAFLENNNSYQYIYDVALVKAKSLFHEEKKLIDKFKKLTSKNVRKENIFKKIQETFGKIEKCNEIIKNENLEKQIEEIKKKVHNLLEKR